jgi:hypothetical protein
LKETATVKMSTDVWRQNEVFGEAMESINSDVWWIKAKFKQKSNMEMSFNF